MDSAERNVYNVLLYEMLKISRHVNRGIADCFGINEYDKDIKEYNIYKKMIKDYFNEEINLSSYF